jgi:hypothetical protein
MLEARECGIRAAIGLTYNIHDHKTCIKKRRPWRTRNAATAEAVWGTPRLEEPGTHRTSGKETLEKLSQWDIQAGKGDLEQLQGQTKGQHAFTN